MRLARLARRLERLEAGAPEAPDDPLALAVCREALEALEDGSYGVGAVITDAGGRVVLTARNEVFADGFASDGHAEMRALSALEREHPEVAPVELTLWVSLEPCPMCLGRIKLSGIGRVRYIAPDPDGGMVHLADRLPRIWRLLHPEQDFAPAEASPAVRRLARQLFRANLRALRQRLLERAGSPS